MSYASIIVSTTPFVHVKPQNIPINERLSYR